jgi:hypothetical protein
MAQTPGYAQWWGSSAHQNLSPRFVALVEEILGEAAEGVDPPQ